MTLVIVGLAEVVTICDHFASQVAKYKAKLGRGSLVMNNLVHCGTINRL